MRLTVLLFLATVAAAAACGPRKPAPVSTLERYGRALEAGDFDAAYRLMSESFRAKHSREEFVRMMRQNQREARDTAARLQGAYDHLEISAEFTFGLGESMRLVQERGQWRIASDPTEFYSQATPREALRSFMRAYELKRWETMLLFVPRRYSERMDVDKLRQQFEGPRREEVAMKMNMLKANLGEPIEERGNEARMPYGERYEVRLVREDDRWKIEDLD